MSHNSERVKAVIFGNKELAIILLVAVFSLAISYFYIGYVPRLEKDALDYYAAANFLQGRPTAAPVQMNRVLTTPLFLYSVIFLQAIFGNYILGLVIFNIVFFFLCLAAFYWLAKEIYDSKKTALWGALLMVTNYYFIDPGNAHLADMAAWFFFLVSTGMAVRYFRTDQRQFFFLTIALAAIGFLFKEYGGLGIISLGILVLISSAAWKQKIKDILLAGVMFSVPFLCYHLFVYFHYHYSYFDWFAAVRSLSSQAGREASRSLALLVKVFGWLFSLGWLAWLVGVKEEIKTGDKAHEKLMLALLPASL
ncbi:glycosyltransferase family 39 protein, partial [Patescibacteria group bacterium]|nr:glycosyltransferase family 39 protein [Patescibacteria group bacterium]